MVDVVADEPAAAGAAARRACLVLVGDVDQLPSVGPGHGARATSSPRRRVPVVRLTEIFRQAEESGIVRAAHRVNHGELPESAAGRTSSATSTSSRPTTPAAHPRPHRRAGPRPHPGPLRPRSASRRAGADADEPLRAGRHATSTRSLQDVLNPPGDEARRSAASAGPSASATRCCRRVNNYDKEVFNGDIGRVRRSTRTSRS